MIVKVSMLADLIDTDYNIRLITRNVMSVFSSNPSYISHLLYKIKHSKYTVDNELLVKSEDIVAYISRDYNIKENVFLYVKKRFDVNKFSEYLNFFDKNHLLWLHFYELSAYDRLLVEILITLLKNKKITVLDYFDDAPFAKDLVSLLFKIGLDDRLIIYPCTSISFGLNNSTCQCYVRDKKSAKVQSRFSEEYLAEELQTSDVRYDSNRPLVYRKNDDYLVPISYKYSLYELLLIFLFGIKMLCIKVFNWSIKCH